MLDRTESARLGSWLDHEGLPGSGDRLFCEEIGGGSQNEILRITRGPLECALRRPPRNSPPQRGEGILREWRIIEALEGTDVPHTKGVAICADLSVLGSPFYLMELVDGWSPAATPGVWPAPFATDLAARRGLAFELVRGIGELSKVDWRTKGLGDLGRPEGFHDRQVDRWLAFLERVRTRELPGLEVATEWLRVHRPLDFLPGIMHGDYQFANVMYRHGAPAQLAAIVDWEMGTVGDPKLDLAWVLQAWPDREGEASTMDYIDLEGLPGRDELAAYYAEVSGRQVDDLDYYVVLAGWKLAIVLEQGYARTLEDPLANEKMRTFGPIVLDLLRRAAELAESTDYRGGK